MRVLLWFQVEYFNNYLLDPKRPSLPEHPANKQQEGKGFPGFQGPPQQMMPMPHMMYRGKRQSQNGNTYFIF